MMWRDVKLVLTVNDILNGTLDVDVSRTRLYEALRSGDLKAKQLGSKYLIPREHFMQWLGLDTTEMLEDRNDARSGAVPADTKPTSDVEVAR